MGIWDWGLGYWGDEVDVAATIPLRAVESRRKQ